VVGFADKFKSDKPDPIKPEPTIEPRAENPFGKKEATVVKPAETIFSELSKPVKRANPFVPPAAPGKQKKLFN
jgi:hypothetical protein